MFELKYSSQAKKFIKKCDKKTKARMKETIDFIAQNPYPSAEFDFKKIAVEKDTYRIRISSHRIIYTIYINQKIIRVLKIERRKDSTYDF